MRSLSNRINSESNKNLSAAQQRRINQIAADALADGGAGDLADRVEAEALSGLSAAQQRRLGRIAADALAGLGCAVLLLGSLSSGAIAADWQPNPDRGAARATISGGRR